MKRSNVLFMISLLYLAIGSQSFADSAGVNHSALSSNRQHCKVRIGGIRLSSHSHRIVVARQATPSELYAAQEFQDHVDALTGERLEIVNPDELGNHFFVAIGGTNLSAIVDASKNLESLGKEGILVRTMGSNLVLAGNQRGVLYACYSFLEDDLGIRWYTPACTVFTKTGTIEINRLDRSYVPPFEYREVGFSKALDADWNVRNKCNGILYDRKNYVRLDESHGGQVDFGGVHSFGWLFLPPAQYFKEHPEYYALVNGKRVADGQVCLTNPDVEDIVVSKIFEMARSKPEMNYISVSQNDCYGNCECPFCKAIDAREGSAAGSMLDFVNRVADRVGKEFPDIRISTLAYQYTQKAPKFVKPRKNVAIILCSIAGSFITPLYDEQNKGFRDDLESWSHISDRLYIWDYNVNYAYCFQPHPNFAVLSPNLKFFIEHHAKGVFEEGYHGDNYGELPELRMWLLSKLLWNPDQDTDTLIKDFLEGYYGPASSGIYRYITLMQTAAQQQKPYMDCFASYKRFKFLSNENIERCAEFFDSAEKVVQDDPVYSERVKIARMPVLYMQIELMHDRLQDIVAEKKAKLVDSYMEKLALFETYAKLGNVQRRGSAMGEKDGLPYEVDEWLAAMRKLVD